MKETNTTKEFFGFREKAIELATKLGYEPAFIAYLKKCNSINLKLYYRSLKAEA